VIEYGQSIEVAATICGAVEVISFVFAHLVILKGTICLLFLR